MNILGLDLGVGSIGWCLIEVDGEYQPIKIMGMGSRIISLTPDESKNFSKGSGLTKCAERTIKRTARKMLNRYQDRRRDLYNRLKELDMLSPRHYAGKTPLEVWQLRSDAATYGKQLSLQEIGDVLRHLLQKRGYRHSKSDTSDAKQTDYVKNVNARWRELQTLNETIGQYTAKKLRESEITTSNGKKVYTYRVKDKGDRVLPRQAYEAEFDRIMSVQAPYYPSVLTEDVIAELKNIIFYQRPLKSCKHLVSKCEFESRQYTTSDGRIVSGGPKVAPRTSPLAEMTRIYEAVNNIVLTNPSNRKYSKERNGQLSIFKEEVIPHDIRLLQYEYTLNAEERARVVDYLLHNNKLTETELLKLLGLRKADGFRADKNVIKGLKGNETYCMLKKALEDVADADDILRFNVRIVDTDKVNKYTGEIIQKVSDDYMEEPLYKLWHLVYSISNRDELAKNLKIKYGISDEKTIDSLYGIDLTKQGFANKSAKFMRELLPYLMQGYKYSDAAAKIGINHSGSLTKEENMARQLQHRLDNIPKGELRQPIVEKILNQMINVVNLIIEEYGKIDVIRVELARELKQSSEQRANATAALSKREKENQKISEILTELGQRAGRRNIQKYRLHQETGGICIYCGQPVSISEFLSGHGGEIEHIVPKSLLFDDSFSNKACACHRCNRDKGQRTGYDYMITRGEDALNKYIDRVSSLYSDGVISKTKRDRLMCEGENIPSDFLERDLRETQYISKKALEILKNICHNVYASSGSVTDFFRHQWGYDMILHTLNLPRYEKANLVNTVDIEHKGQLHSEKRIENWSKRMDHRHHAIDALVIALTRQSYVQRLNNLNKESDSALCDPDKQSDSFKHQVQQFEKWARTRPHFSVDEVSVLTDNIAVSFKPGKKLTTPGKRYANRGGHRILQQTGLQVPRGSLHQETVYGKVKLPDGEKSVKFAFEHPELIINEQIRKEVLNRIQLFDGDSEKAISSIKKNPLYDSDNEKIKKVDCYRNEYVYRVGLSGLEYKNIDKIIDPAIRHIVKVRYDECGKNSKKFQQSLIDEPLTIGENPPRIVETVRCTTGLVDDKMVATRRSSDGNVIGYSKSGNNHHVAFYLTPNGDVEVMVSSFWVCIKRKNMGIPIVIESPEEAWDILNSKTYSDDVEEVGRSLPLPNRKFLFSLQMNEMVILGLSEDALRDAILCGDKKTLCRHLYRVQKLSAGSYVFRYHTHTVVDMDEKNSEMDYYKLLTSYKAIKNQNLTKVRVNSLGQIAIDNKVI